MNYRMIEAIDETIVVIAAHIKEEVKEQHTLNTDKVSALACLARARADVALYISRAEKRCTQML